MQVDGLVLPILSYAVEVWGVRPSTYRAVAEVLLQHVLKVRVCCRVEQLAT